MAQFRLLGLSGSLRRASNSTAVLHGLLDALAPKAALKIFPLRGVPLYNEDDDASMYRNRCALCVRPSRAAMV